MSNSSLKVTLWRVGHHDEIREKTVSVHVSNLLQKTGTTSRIELAALARRSSSHQPAGG